MPFTYSQSTGRFSRDGVLIGGGYSGHGAGLDDPAMEQVADVGPIPAGDWTIAKARDRGHLGPTVMDLAPVAPFAAFGRTLFRIHGDNPAANHTASDGCIILEPQFRTRIAAAVAAGDNRLLVTA
jgi:Protein of unknown function (DUF2778)